MYKQILSEIEKNIDEAIASVKKTLWLRTWEFQQNKNENYDESQWEKVKDPSWAPAEGNAFLRHSFIVPQEIEKIPVAGSDIGIEFIFPSGIELFIDGTMIYKQKYWADARTEPMIIIKNAQPGATHTLLFKVPEGDGHSGIYAILRIEKVEDALFELSAIRYQIAYAVAIAKEKKSRVLEQTIHSAISAINPSDIAGRNWKSVFEQIRKAETILEPFRKHAKRINVHLIGHAHIDMNWLWNYENTKDVCVRDFTSVIALMRKFPDLTFSQSQACVYKIVEQENKELFQNVVQRIKEKRWEVTATAWSENDLNMSHGESIARHIIYSKKYTREKLGKLSSVMWCPDTFGHPATMPAICADAGIKYYFHMRCGKDYPLYVWEGPDGKKVISCKAVYNNWISPERIIPPLLKFKEYLPVVTEVMFPYGVGDHGGGPTKKDYRMKKKMEQKPVMPSLVFSTVEKYFHSVEKFKKYLPVVKGELNTIFEGCYTTHSDIKTTNRHCEDILLTLESAMALGLINNILEEKDKHKLEQFWQHTLFNQFHDILCGSAIKSSYQYSVELGGRVISESKKMLEDYVKKIPPAGEKALVIFNPCGWEREALINHNSGSFIQKIPAFGIMAESKEFIPESSKRNIKQKSEDEWETDFYHISIDKNTGTIRTLFDKKSKRYVLSIASPAIAEDPSSWWAETSSNLFSVNYEQPHRMSAWIIGNILRTDYLYEIAEKQVISEPFRTIISVVRKYKNSLITQKTILYPDFPFIDFDLSIDWNEIGGSKEGVPMLRTNFSFAMENPAVFYEIPFGSISRPACGKEYPALRWAAMKEKGFCAGILTKNRHGFNSSGKRLSITLLRNAYEPDSQSDTGKHEISYRLVWGKLNEIKMTKLANEFTMPVVAIDTQAKKGYSFSPFEIEGNVLPSALKPSIDCKSVVLRVIEMLGKKQNFTIKFKKKPSRICLSNIAEECVSKIPVKEEVKMALPAYGIITIKINY